MKTIDELKAKQARELAELERELKLAELLPVPAQQVCQHRDYTSIIYKKPYPDRYTMKEAADIYAQFTDVVEAEHWRNGCLSVAPAEINSYAKEENATMDGASHAELKLQAGKGFESHELTFFARAKDGTLLKVAIELRPEWKWLPQVDTRYDRDGNVISNRVSPVGIGEDQFRKWGIGGDQGYLLSYYWADRENFHSWLSSQNIFIGRFAENN